MVLDYILPCFWGNADEMKDDAGIQMNLLEVIGQQLMFFLSHSEFCLLFPQLCLQSSFSGNSIFFRYNNLLPMI